MSSLDSDQGLEQILQSVGDKGIYQSRLYWFYFIPYAFVMPWTIMVQIFQTSTPNHWCYVPGKPTHIPLETWKNMTIPWTKEHGIDVQSQCKQFNMPQYGHENISDKIVDCQHSWSYDKTWYDRTIATDHNWVCERNDLPATLISVGRSGNVVGSLVFSYLADVCGRKSTVIITTLFYGVSAIARVFMTSDWSLMLFMFLSSLPFPSIFDVFWILVVEQISIDARSRFTGTSFLMWTFGSSTVALLAWLSRDYVTLGIVTSIPFLFSFIIWWFIPESPKWLISRGHVKKSLEAFQRIATINGNECPPDLENTLKKIAESQKNQTTLLSYLSFLELFTYPVIRKRVLLLVFCFTSNVMLYWGITYNVSNLSGNEFLNFFYLSICELPGIILACFCAEKFGRRFSEAGSFFLVALTTFITIFVTPAEPQAEIYFLIICKVWVTISFFVMYIQLLEILPTSHRASGTGFMTIVSSTVAISAPYIAHSSSYWDPFPYLFFTLFGLSSGIAALFLPETIGGSLPQTVSNSNEFLTDQPFWSYLGWKPKKKSAERNLRNANQDGHTNYGMSM